MNPNHLSKGLQVDMFSISLPYKSQVSFKNYEYLVTLDKMRIYVYLRDREASESE